MPGQVLADRWAVAVDEIENARGHPRLVHDLGKDDAADRRDLARLEHHRTACRNGRGDLAHDLVKRPVPGCDQPDHADGLTHNARVATLKGELELLERLDRRLQMYLSCPGLRFA